MRCAIVAGTLRRRTRGERRIRVRSHENFPHSKNRVQIVLMGCRFFCCWHHAVFSLVLFFCNCRRALVVAESKPLTKLRNPGFTFQLSRRAKVVASDRKRSCAKEVVQTPFINQRRCADTFYRSTILASVDGTWGCEPMRIRLLTSRLGFANARLRQFVLPISAELFSS